MYTAPCAAILSVHIERGARFEHVIEKKMKLHPRHIHFVALLAIFSFNDFYISAMLSRLKNAKGVGAVMVRSVTPTGCLGTRSGTLRARSRSRSRSRATNCGIYSTFNELDLNLKAHAPNTYPLPMRHIFIIIIYYFITSQCCTTRQHLNYDLLLHIRYSLVFM